MAIPTRIIQTGKTSDLPVEARVSATTMKLLHPDWEYLFFDDTAVQRFIACEFPQYQGVFDGFARPIQRIDLFRYLAVYRLGGFYFDLDVFLCKSLTDLREHEAVFPFEELTMNEFLDYQYGVNWEVGNYGFGAVQGSRFLERVIDNCIKAQRDPAWVRPMMAGIPRLLRPDFSVLNTTGPGLVSRTLAEAKSKPGNDLVHVLMPDDIYQQDNWHKFGGYGIHLMAGSWHTRSDLLRRVAWWRLTRSMKRRNSSRSNRHSSQTRQSAPVLHTH